MYVYLVKSDISSHVPNTFFHTLSLTLILIAITYLLIMVATLTNSCYIIFKDTFAFLSKLTSQYS